MNREESEFIDAFRKLLKIGAIERREEDFMALGKSEPFLISESLLKELWYEYRMEQQQAHSAQFSGSTPQLVDQKDRRKHNTLPKKEEVTVTFHEHLPQPARIEFKVKGQWNNREQNSILATIHFKVNVSHLVCDEPWPLALRKNGAMGLENCMRHFGIRSLKDRTFTVFNKNDQTYQWREVRTS